MLPALSGLLAWEGAVVAVLFLAPRLLYTLSHIIRILARSVFLVRSYF